MENHRVMLQLGATEQLSDARDCARRIVDAHVPPVEVDVLDDCDHLVYGCATRPGPQPSLEQVRRDLRLAMGYRPGVGSLYELPTPQDCIQTWNRLRNVRHASEVQGKVMIRKLPDNKIWFGVSV